LGWGRANRQSHRSGGLRRRLAIRFGDQKIGRGFSRAGLYYPYIEMRDVASFETGGQGVPGPPR
jgi:hypothetical protein